MNACSELTFFPLPLSLCCSIGGQCSLASDGCQERECVTSKSSYLVITITTTYIYTEEREREGTIPCVCVCARVYIPCTHSVASAMSSYMSDNMKLVGVATTTIFTAHSTA